ncbi:Hint domain-containing protein [Roseivivax sp. CAU 1753]
MATYIIVDKDKNPLGPNEIRAGDTIDVSSGDIFIVSAAVDDNIKFESATGNPTNFEIQFETSNANDFTVDIEENLDAGIVISNGVDLSDVDIQADKALSVIMTAGNNVSLGKFEGSEHGVDLLTIGDDFTTNHDIKLNGGDNFLSIGDNATIRTIEAKDGSDTIIIGDGLVADDIKTGDGADALTIGDDAVLDNIETNKGDDTITIGDNLFADDIKTGEGADGLTIGDGGLVDDIDTGKGNDTVSVGDFFTADELETKDGDDLVIVGVGGSIGDLDGGDGNDTLDSDTNFPGATSFETICFARRTFIETEYGSVPIEALRVGDQVKTLDNGLQSIRWIGSTRVPGHGANAPVRIAAGVLGNARPLWVSQQHRMLLSGWEIELNFGEAEVLIPAKHLVDIAGIEIVEVPSVEYFHMLLDRHEIVFAEGIESESFHPGAVGLNTLSHQAFTEVTSLFPALLTDPDSFGQSARLSLKSFEAHVLAA